MFLAWAIYRIGECPASSIVQSGVLVLDQVTYPSSMRLCRTNKTFKTLQKSTNCAPKTTVNSKAGSIGGALTWNQSCLVENVQYYDDMQFV